MMTQCKFFRGLVLGIASSVFLTGCFRKASVAPTEVQTGTASWYGYPFHGRLTASGEIFDMNQKTAAHRTLPFGTVLRVLNLTNGKQINVRVNDRGPFVKERVIDLSYAAAQAISMPGIAQVELRVMSIPVKRGLDLYSVQIGSYSYRGDAEKLRAQLMLKFPDVNVIYRDCDQTWRVLIGRRADLGTAKALALLLERETGFAAFVVRLDEG